MDQNFAFETRPLALVKLSSTLSKIDNASLAKRITIRQQRNISFKKEKMGSNDPPPPRLLHSVHSAFSTPMNAAPMLAA